MKKIINVPENAVDDMLRGYLKCHKKIVTRGKNPRVFVQKSSSTDPRVAVVSGGGSGHFPAFIGYVKPHMLDAVAVGEIFVAPPPEVFLDAFCEADRGQGVICLHGNYPLDNCNVQAAIQMARERGIDVRAVAARDDVAPSRSPDSRGLTGEVFLLKIGAAAAAAGLNLDQVEEVCRSAAEDMRSIGVGLSACTIPAVGIPNFDVVEGTMEMGIGHHGDPGITTYRLRPASEIADLMLEEIFRDFPLERGDEIAVIVSGLGSTSQLELYILFDRISDVIQSRKLKLPLSYVGNYFTSLDMCGATITVMKLDRQRKSFLKYKEALCF